MDALQISPSVWLGSYQALCDKQFVEQAQVKVIINCSPTYKFLHILHSSDLKISSDLIILLLDPSFEQTKFNEDELALLDDYIVRFNRILQNYIHFFYDANPSASNMIHKNLYDRPLSISSPVLSGNLLSLLFNINRLVKLLRSINPSMGVFVVSEDGNNVLSTALAMSYLMDSYGFNFDASFNNIASFRPSVAPFNLQFYDDLLIAQALKNFYGENQQIKQKSTGVLTTNCRLKRKNDYIAVGGESKKKNLR